MKRFIPLSQRATFRRASGFGRAGRDITGRHRGDAHHEDLIWYCGHAVDKGGGSSGLASGFDQGRQAIDQGLAGSHTFGGTTYWGNTRQFKQCDGDYAGSNGNVTWWRIPSWNH